MAKSTLNIGQELHSDSIVYRIESVLGQGSFGVTYKAKAFTVMKGKFGEELVETNTPKAIKEFFMKEVNERDESGSITGMSEGSLSYNYAQKFKKEAENLASINHPNIVKVIDFISTNNTYYYVMDHIDGENLNDYLKHHKMSEKEAVNTISEVAKALQYMHEEKHMLHLDLKPGNIMRRNGDGHIFLIDFGLSKHYSEDGVPETSTSVGLGGPRNITKKKANSKNVKQFRATLDVYALGATFYKLLTGQTPPSADELVSNEGIIKEELSKLGISETLVSIVVQAMRPNVKERIQGIADFIDILSSKKTKSDTIPVSGVDESTRIDFLEREGTATKKMPSKQLEAPPKKDFEPHKESSPKNEKAKTTPRKNNEKERSIIGYAKYLLIFAALCLLYMWFNEKWIFAPKEVNTLNQIQVKERTIKELLLLPYGCLSKEIDNSKKAEEALTKYFGSYEIIDNYAVGLHRSEKFDFSYRGTPIGVSYITWDEEEQLGSFWCYIFYFQTRNEAESFSSIIAKDIIDAGIPLKKDKTLGVMSYSDYTLNDINEVQVWNSIQIEENDYDIRLNVHKKENVGMFYVKLLIRRKQ